MDWEKVLQVFVVGIIFSFAALSFTNDGGFAAAVAVCFVGAVIVGHISRKDQT